MSVLFLSHVKDCILRKIETTFVSIFFRADDFKLAPKKEWDQVGDDTILNTVDLGPTTKRKLPQLGPILPKRFAHLKTPVTNITG